MQSAVATTTVSLIGLVLEQPNSANSALRHLTDRKVIGVNFRSTFVYRHAKMPTLYVASGLGFSARARTLVLGPIVAKLKEMGFRVIEPFADNNELALDNDRTIDGELEIAHADMKSVVESDGVLCILSSPIPDEGSMIEVGIAMALKKPVFYLNDDFRYHIAATAQRLPVNLMLFAHANAQTWQRYYYTSIEELLCRDKGLHKWMTHSKKTVADVVAEQ